LTDSWYSNWIESEDVKQSNHLKCSDVMVSLSLNSYNRSCPVVMRNQWRDSALDSDGVVLQIGQRDCPGFLREKLYQSAVLLRQADMCFDQTQADLRFQSPAILALQEASLFRHAASISTHCSCLSELPLFRPVAAVSVV
jgi:hypothetical protein